MSCATLHPDVASRLREGTVIPAHPLALTPDGTLDERRQRALTRYYLAAGAGGIAVGVHTTQFAIRDHSLYAPVLELAMATARERALRPIAVAGVCGETRQALGEAQTAARIGYDLALVSLGGLDRWSDDRLVDHVAAVSEVLPVFGFYLQPRAGGRRLGYRFWRRAAELPGLVAIKIAPFDRYATVDVVRAVCESGRHQEIALYTGNDDNIVADLTSTFRFPSCGGTVETRIVGGLLGQWAVWTRRAVELLERCHRGDVAALDGIAAQLTDANGAIFDTANAFRGCVPGIHEVLRRQGLLDSPRCLDPSERLSPGQLEEIARVCGAYPHLADDEFVRDNLPGWLRP